VMSGAGSALMGIGSSRGDDRSVAAAEMAISSPLLEASIDGAHGVLLSIQGGSDLGLFEINEAAQLVANSAAPDANIIFGAVIDDALGDEVRVTVIAAGFDETQNGRSRSNRPASAYQPSQGSDAFGAPWRPVTLPSIKDPGVPASDSAGLDDVGSASGGQFDSSLTGYNDAVAASSPSSEPATRAVSDAGVSNGTDGAVAGGSVFEPAPPAVDAGGLTVGGDYASGPVVHERDPGPYPVRGDVPNTRRRSVVFEEDDELDVPDFLK